MIDDNKKMFIPPLAIENDIFFKSLYDVKPKAQSECCGPYCAFAHNGQLLYEMAPLLKRALSRWGAGRFF
jgi:hypothetical protein